MARIVVIGAGISGLACAHGLLDAVPDANVTVLEASRRAGGPVHSISDAGFLCEEGPNGFLNRHPSTLALAVRLGLEDEAISGDESIRRRFVLVDGRLRRFPDSPRALASSDLLSLRGRARAALEPLIPAREGGGEETVAQFARRRFGREAARVLIGPMITGIYAGDSERLSAEAALPHLVGLERRGRSILMSLLASRQRRGAPSPARVSRERLCSFRGGMGRLIEAASGALGARLRLQSPVLGIHRDGDTFRIDIGGMRPDELHADVVISAAPALAASRYLSAIAPAATEALGEIDYAPAVTVAIGFLEPDVPHPLDGFGYLVAANPGERVIGVYWASSMYPGHRAPAGKVLLQVILGGAHNRDICDDDDETLLATTCDHLRRVLGICAAPVFHRITRHRVGLPQYELGHRDRVAAVERSQAEVPGLFVAGNALRGVGINPSTADAERIVARVAKHVLARPALAREA